jgi:molybdenum cofactor cytidylyltransferase
MGTPKPMLKVGNRTFLEHMISTLKGGGCEKILVCLPDEHGPIAAKTLQAGGTVILNTNPKNGPISSLQVAIAHLNPEISGVLFCPVDYPLVTVQTIQTLVSSFKTIRAPVTLPTFKGKKGHPVIFHRDLFQELLEDDLPEGARTVVIKNLANANLIDIDDNGVTIDIDDLATYRRHFPKEYRARFSAR